VWRKNSDRRDGKGHELSLEDGRRGRKPDCPLRKEPTWRLDHNCHSVIASAEAEERWLYCFLDDAFAEY
jgi:hypothetical protein